ncbi:hypothetical protein OQA88_2936 [Cercophora sp. LCS_1]
MPATSAHRPDRRPIYERRRVSPKRSSSASTSSFSDDDDAITPCPPEMQVQEQQQPQQRPRPQPERVTSWRSSMVMHPDSPATSDSDIDSETLWRRMLEIQRTFGCYNSARMDAALENGEGVAPPRTCLDLLNDSIDQLPEESKKQLEEYLEHGEAPTRRKGWRVRLLHR